MEGEDTLGAALEEAGILGAGISEAEVGEVTAVLDTALTGADSMAVRITTAAMFGQITEIVTMTSIRIRMDMDTAHRIMAARLVLAATVGADAAGMGTADGTALMLEAALSLRAHATTK